MIITAPRRDTVSIYELEARTWYLWQEPTGWLVDLLVYVSHAIVQGTATMISIVGTTWLDGLSV